MFGLCGEDVNKDDLAWLHYCVSLLEMLSNSEMAFIEDVKIDLKVMSFTGKKTDDYLFDSTWLNQGYEHTTAVTGVKCDFFVFRQ